MNRSSFIFPFKTHRNQPLNDIINRNEPLNLGVYIGETITQVGTITPENELQIIREFSDEITFTEKEIRICHSSSSPNRHRLIPLIKSTSKACNPIQLQKLLFPLSDEEALAMYFQKLYSSLEDSGLNPHGNIVIALPFFPNRTEKEKLYQALRIANIYNVRILTSLTTTAVAYAKCDSVKFQPSGHPILVVQVRKQAFSIAVLDVQPDSVVLKSFRETYDQDYDLLFNQENLTTNKFVKILEKFKSAVNSMEVASANIRRVIAVTFTKNDSALKQLLHKTFNADIICESNAHLAGAAILASQNPGENLKVHEVLTKELTLKCDDKMWKIPLESTHPEGPIFEDEIWVRHDGSNLVLDEYIQFDGKIIPILVGHYRAISIDPSEAEGSCRAVITIMLEEFGLKVAISFPSSLHGHIFRIDSWLAGLPCETLAMKNIQQYYEFKGKEKMTMEVDNPKLIQLSDDVLTKSVNESVKSYSSKIEPVIAVECAGQQVENLHHQLEDIIVQQFLRSNRQNLIAGRGAVNHFIATLQKELKYKFEHLLRKHKLATNSFECEKIRRNPVLDKIPTGTQQKGFADSLKTENILPIKHSPAQQNIQTKESSSSDNEMVGINIPTEALDSDKKICLNNRPNFFLPDDDEIIREKLPEQFLPSDDKLIDQNFYSKALSSNDELISENFQTNASPPNDELVRENFQAESSPSDNQFISENFQTKSSSSDEKLISENFQPKSSPFDDKLIVEHHQIQKIDSMLQKIIEKSLETGIQDGLKTHKNILYSMTDKQDPYTDQQVTQFHSDNLSEVLEAFDSTFKIADIGPLADTIKSTRQKLENNISSQLITFIKRHEAAMERKSKKIKSWTLEAEAFYDENMEEYKPKQHTPEEILAKHNELEQEALTTFNQQFLDSGFKFHECWTTELKTKMTGFKDEYVNIPYVDVDTSKLKQNFTPLMSPGLIKNVGGTSPSKNAIIKMQDLNNSDENLTAQPDIEIEAQEFQQQSSSPKNRKIENEEKIKIIQPWFNKFLQQSHFTHKKIMELLTASKQPFVHSQIQDYHQENIEAIKIAFKDTQADLLLQEFLPPQFENLIASDINDELAIYLKIHDSTMQEVMIVLDDATKMGILSYEDKIKEIGPADVSLDEAVENHREVRAQILQEFKQTLEEDGIKWHDSFKIELEYKLSEKLLALLHKLRGYNYGDDKSEEEPEETNTEDSDDGDNYVDQVSGNDEGSRDCGQSGQQQSSGSGDTILQQDQDNSESEGASFEQDQEKSEHGDKFFEQDQENSESEDTFVKEDQEGPESSVDFEECENVIEVEGDDINDGDVFIEEPLDEPIKTPEPDYDYDPLQSPLFDYYRGLNSPEDMDLILVESPTPPVLSESDLLQLAMSTPFYSRYYLSTIIEQPTEEGTEVFFPNDESLCKNFKPDNPYKIQNTAVRSTADENLDVEKASSIIDNSFSEDEEQEINSKLNDNNYEKHKENQSHLPKQKLEEKHEIPEEKHEILEEKHEILEEKHEILEEKHEILKENSSEHSATSANNCITEIEEHEDVEEITTEITTKITKAYPIPQKLEEHQSQMNGFSTEAKNSPTKVNIDNKSPEITTNGISSGKSSINGDHRSHQAILNGNSKEEFENCEDSGFYSLIKENGFSSMNGVHEFEKTPSSRNGHYEFSITSVVSNDDYVNGFMKTSSFPQESQKHDNARATIPNGIQNSSDAVATDVSIPGEVPDLFEKSVIHKTINNETKQKSVHNGDDFYFNQKSNPEKADAEITEAIRELSSSHQESPEGGDKASKLTATKRKTGFNRKSAVIFDTSLHMIL